jgi:pimeloyl-ACP methyl ester carboxylesterase
MLNHLTNDVSLIQHGSGEPTLVFLHYFSGSAASWQWVTEALKQSYHCVALDLPGFGDAPPLEEPSLKSYSTFVQNLIAQLGIGRFVLIGHSMGSKIALQVAADMQSDGLEHVILIAPSPPTQEPMPDEERQRMLSDHTSQENAAKTVEGASHKPLPELRHAVAVQTHVKADDTAWRWWLLKGMNHSIADQMERIRVPVTVVASKDDPVIPYEKIQQDITNLLPNATLIEMHDVGHLIPLEAPSQVAQYVRQVVAA